MRIGLATEAREGPNNQDKAEHVIALSDLLVEGMKAPYHPPWIAEEVADKSSPA